MQSVRAQIYYSSAGERNRNAADGWDWWEARDDLPEPMRPIARHRIEDAFAGRRGVVKVFPTPEGPGYDVGSSG